MAEISKGTETVGGRVSTAPDVIVTAGRPKKSSTLRRVLVGVLVFLACVGGLGSTVTIWAHRTVLDSNTFVATVGSVTSNPQLIDAVSTAAATQVVTKLGIQQHVAQALPPRLDFLTPQLATAVQSFTRTSLQTVLRRPALQRVLTTLVRGTHERLIAILRGNGKYATISNGALTLNLVPVIVDGVRRLQQQHPQLFAGRPLLQDLAASTSPAQARQTLEQAFGVHLSNGFGEIVLFRSKKLESVQQIVKLFDALVIALPVVTILLIAVAIWLSLNRRRTILQLGIGLVIAFALARLLIQFGVDPIFASMRNATARDVLQATTDSVLSGLATLTVILAAAGLVVAVAAFLAGKATGDRRQARLRDA